MSSFVSKQLQAIEVEAAHGGSGARRVIFSRSPEISSALEAFTRGYLEPQGVFDWHSHEQIDEFFVCEQGKGLVQIENGDPVKYSPGSVFYVPAGLKHRIEAWGEETSEFYFVRIRNEASLGK